MNIFIVSDSWIFFIFFVQFSTLVRGAYGMFPQWDSLIAAFDHNFTNQFPSTFDQNRMDIYIKVFFLKSEFDLYFNDIISTALHVICDIFC